MNYYQYAPLTMRFINNSYYLQFNASFNENTDSHYL
jgi:hypothetical protein